VYILVSRQKSFLPTPSLIPSNKTTLAADQEYNIRQKFAVHASILKMTQFIQF